MPVMKDLTIRVLQPGDEAVLEAFLLPRLAASMFLIGNMRMSGIAYNGERYTGTYVAAFEEEQVVAAAAHFWNQNLILQAPVHLDALWRAALKLSGRPLKGVIGPYEQVRAVSAALSLDTLPCQMNSRETLYNLDLADLIVPEALQSGRVTGRRVEARDLETLIRWRVGYEIEVLGETETPQLWERERAEAERVVQDGYTWILEAGGRPVATSAFNTRLKEAVQIGGVWTPPEFRGRGYARCVVAQSLLDARAGGANIAILFTGEENIPAQKAYTALGFRHIGDYHLLLLRDALDVS